MAERRYVVLCSGRYSRKYVYPMDRTKKEAQKFAEKTEQGATVRCRIKKMPCKYWDYKLRCLGTVH